METICGCINKGSVVNLEVLLVQEKTGFSDMGQI